MGRGLHATVMLPTNARGPVSVSGTGRHTPLASVAMANLHEAAPTTRRPVGITVLVVLGVVQGLLIVATGVFVISVSDNRDLARDSGVSADGILAVGIGLVAMGLLAIALAIGLARGSNLVRALFATVATVQVAVTTFGLLTVRDLRAGSVVALALAALMIWLLFGAPHTTEFFDR